MPILSFGAMFNIVENQIILRKCLDWGINYWDTAYVYANGNSEIGIGKYLAKNPAGYCGLGGTGVCYPKDDATAE